VRPPSKSSGVLRRQQGAVSKKPSDLTMEVTGWTKTGQLSLLLKTNSKQYHYTYYVDAAKIPCWIREMKRHPGRVLNEIKEDHHEF